MNNKDNRSIKLLSKDAKIESDRKSISCWQSNKMSELLGIGEYTKEDKGKKEELNIFAISKECISCQHFKNLSESFNNNKVVINDSVACEITPKQKKQRKTIKKDISSVKKLQKKSNIKE